MCKCCTHRQGSEKNSLYEFLHFRTPDHDAMSHSHEHDHADEHDDLQDHKVVSDLNRGEQEPHQEQ